MLTFFLKLFDLSSALYSGIFRLRDLLLSVSLDDNLTTILCLVISRSGGVQFLCCPCSCMCSFLFIRLEGFCQPARVGGSLADGSGPLGSPIPAMICICDRFVFQLQTACTVIGQH